MREKIKKTIEKYRLLKYKDPVIVGLSGGADSVCLVYVLSGMGYRVRAAHINHMLREDASQDADFVREFCTSIGVPIDCVEIDVKALAEKQRISLETAGRDARYRCFAELAERYGGKIATAHNLNDNAESFVMHLLRGSGMAGLVGIRPKVMREGATVIRPLIEIEREEIEGYCREQGLKVRHDYTNDDDDFTRNDIRHNVMPILAERGGFLAISRATDILSVEEEFFEKYVGEVCDSHLHEGSIDLKVFNGLDLAVRRRVVRRMLGGGVDMGFVHIEAIVEMAERGVGGKVIELPGGRCARCMNGKLQIQ